MPLPPLLLLLLAPRIQVSLTGEAYNDCSDVIALPGKLQAAWRHGTRHNRTTRKRGRQEMLHSYL